MDTDVLKVFAGTYVTESNISNKDKLYLLNFIKEAEKDSVLSLLATGIPSNVVTESEIPLEYVDQWVEELVEYEKMTLSQYKTRYGNQPKGNYPGAGSKTYYRTNTAIAKDIGKKVAVAAVVAAAVAAAYLAYKRFFSKAAKACKGAEDRAACLKKYKEGAKKARIAALKSKAAGCAKTKDPAKCKASIAAKVSKIG